MRERVIEFWFEFASPYSHIAAQGIEKSAAGAGARVAWRPFLLGPIFRNQGWNNSPLNIYAAKVAYMWKDMARECAKYGVPLRKPSGFPRVSLLATRVALWAEDQSSIGDFVRGVYLANFRDDLDIADHAIVRSTLQSACPFEADEWLRKAELPEIKNALRERSNKAASRGGFGAPTFFASGEMFWGNDRLDDAIARL